MNKMKLIKDLKIVKEKQLIKYGNDLYYRTLYTNNFYTWEPVNYDGDCAQETLERAYQRDVQGYH